MNLVDTLKNIEKTLIELQLDEVYGVISGMSKSASGKTAPSFTFCKAENLDGSVIVWSPKFIQVKWQTRFHALPHRNSEIFKSYEEFEQAMTTYFGKYVRVSA
jgi:hypothetical protein